MATVACSCSLHPMDVRLLKLCISAMQGGMMPDFKEEVARRAQRATVLNWSRKVIRAAAALEEAVPREKWLLYTRYRPFFVTTDDPDHAAELNERFFSVRSLGDILNFFLEEVARIDPERATEIIETAKADQTPGMLDYQSPDGAAENLRKFLLHQRRQIEALAGGNADQATLAAVGRQLAWRTCYMLADMHPSWCTRTVSLTSLNARGDLGLEKFVADPRGMYAGIVKQTPALQAYIPYSLGDDSRTGMCIPPRAVAGVLALMDGWPQPIMPHPTCGVPTPGEVQALREALIFAQRNNMGLWEASGMVDPEQELFPYIQEQNEPVEAPEPEEELVAVSAGHLPKEAVYEQKLAETRSVEENEAKAQEDAKGGKRSFFGGLFKKKS